MQGQHAGNGHRAYRLRLLTLHELSLASHQRMDRHPSYYNVRYLMHCTLVLLQEPKEIVIPYMERFGRTTPGDLYLGLGTRELMLNFL